ncbi:MAG: TerB family tellurite resistance protein [Halioglobus sp.]|nr:TerB family tellurite resistance protein [Halioglobus sp.]MCB1707572.1 TerB family tellurite resistance protein [Halioglobus sp.]MCP5122056.1 TerB family tellurite resistance protein [Pseudomonadales bacterium]MCP5192398.1 TerB family tellurite resistance protein [Pseudomonadales bacterium]
MINAFRKLFETPARETGAEREHRQRLAAAALLIETARADFSEDGVEEAVLTTLLCETLGLDAAQVSELLVQASAQLDEAASLYDFTRVINDHYSAAQKLELITNMWRVAYADGRLDKYEEYLIRQVAELTYVPHSDYIRAKLVAKA